MGTRVSLLGHGTGCMFAVSVDGEQKHVPREGVHAGTPCKLAGGYCALECVNGRHPSSKTPVGVLTAMDMPE